MANYSTLKAAVADVVKTNGSQAITGANLQTVLLSIINSIGGGGYIFEGVATTSTDAGTPDQNVFYIGGAGTYANFGTSVVVPPTNIAVFKYNGTWNCEQLTVENGGVFDISAFKAVGGTLTTYADLEAALGTNGANVPEGVRKGGMSIKFVQSSDNKYMQFRLLKKIWSTTVSDWQGVDNEPTDGSKNLVESGGVKEYVDNYVNVSQLLTLDVIGNNVFDETYVRKNKNIRTTSPYNIKDYSGISITGFYKIPSECNRIQVSGIVSSTGLRCRFSKLPTDDAESVAVTCSMTGYYIIDITPQLRDYPYFCAMVYSGTEGNEDFSNVFISFGYNLRKQKLSLGDITGLKMDYPNKIATPITGYVKWDSGEITSSGYHTSNDIPVKFGDRITINNIRAAAVVAMVAAYSANGTYLQAKSVKGNSTDLSSYLYVVPDGVAFVRICTYDTFLTTITYSIEKASEINEITVGKSYGNEVLTISGKYVRILDGEERPNEFFDCSDYLPVTPGAKFRCLFYAVSSAGVCFYDQERTYIGSYWQSSAYYPIEYTVPDGAAYARFCNRTEYIATPYFELINKDYSNLRLLTKAIEDNKSENSAKSILRLYPQTKLPCVSFQFDDARRNDRQIVELFESKHLTCAFAYVASDSRIGENAPVYLNYQRRGFQIMNHSIDGTIFNLDNYTYQTALEAIFTAKKKIENEGMVCNGFVAPSSQMAAEFMPILKLAHAYAFTTATTSPTANSRTQDTCDLHRYSLQSNTLAQIEQFIDDCITNDQIITFAGHSADLVEGGDTTVWSLAKLSAVIDYCIAKRDAGLLYIGGTDDCVKYFFDL